MIPAQKCQLNSEKLQQLVLTSAPGNPTDRSFFSKLLCNARPATTIMLYLFTSPSKHENYANYTNKVTSPPTSFLFICLKKMLQTGLDFNQLLFTQIILQGKFHHHQRSKERCDVFDRARQDTNDLICASLISTFTICDRLLIFILCKSPEVITSITKFIYFYQRERKRKETNSQS